MSAIQDDIESRLAAVEPDVEVLLAEIVGGQRVRLYIDHPDGVTLALCERVSNHLAPIRERYTLEVSSPGVERPLTKPEHFRRYIGRRARVRTRGDAGGAGQAGGRARNTFTGELLGATDTEVTVAADTGVVSIAYADIRRSNLLGE